MIFLLLVLAWPLLALAEPIEPLRWPISPRVMAMGEAYVAVADDPSAVYSNPAGIRTLRQVCYEVTYNDATTRPPEHWAASLANPGTETGTAVGLSVWSQGISSGEDFSYYVPATGLSWQLAGSSILGLVTRFPYLRSQVDSIKSRWETIGDFSALQSFGHFRLGATVERAFGGAASIVPRRLHAGAAFSSEGITFAYEWRGDETDRKFDFRRASSHWGAEAILGQYAAIRIGYIATETHRLTFGGAIGLMKAGWRTEFGWNVPATRHGWTGWSVGLGYRI